MKLFRVRAEKRDYFTGHTAKEGELITAKERNTKFRYLEDYLFQPVNVKASAIVHKDGARYERGF